MTALVAILPTAIAALLLLCSALFAVRAWLTGRFSIRDRVMGFAELLGIVTVFALTVLLGDWAHTPLALWVIALALTAAGTAGVALRFTRLPWLRGRRRLPLRIVRLSMAALVSATVIAVALA